MSDGTFRPGGVTAWSAYNTPRIWAMVEPEDDPESWRQVAALGSMAGLLHDQRKRLEAAREGLIQAWPPEKNSAAQAFVELIDDLLANMRRNKEIADTNAGALGQVLETLRRAKADIAPLYQAYVEKSDDWVPAWWDGAEDELDEQARRRMRAAEEVIAHPDNTIRAPQVYELRPDFTRTRIDDDGDDLSSGGRPGSSGAAAGSAFPVPHEPPPPLPGRDVRGPDEAAPVIPSGPELAGVLTPPAVSGGLPFAVPPATVSAPAALPGLVIGGAVPLPSSPPRVGGSAGGTRSGGGGGFGSSPGVGPVGGSPRGGAGAKPVTPSWLPPVPNQPTRAGATGQSTPGGSNAGRGGVGPPMTPLAGGRRSPEERSSAMTFDPDNPWATAEGVDPVIAPSERIHRHDPGPGVIGWQR